MTLPNSIFSGMWQEGHVQGIAVDAQHGFVYYSFTTVLVKTDLQGNPLATVENLIGHLGCIAFDGESNRLYGSLELKHDAIGQGIMARTGKALPDEDAFYLVCFDLDKLDHMGMDAEKDKVMLTVYARDVVNDYSGVDPYSGKPGCYGCAGIDGISVGPVFGTGSHGPRKIMLAMGIRKDLERTDNDHQILLQYDLSVFNRYGQTLDQTRPHHSGPEMAEQRYFFYTGNTNWGVQNLEYDAGTGYWFTAVYEGAKPQFENYYMFAIDGNIPAKPTKLEGRGSETGMLLTSVRIGADLRGNGIYGTYFPYGSTGIASMGDGTFYISHDGQTEDRVLQFTHIHRYRFDPVSPYWFTRMEA